MIHEGLTVTYPRNETAYEPPPGRFAWNQLDPEKSWQDTAGQTTVEWQSSQFPSWRFAQAASFTAAAEAAGRKVSEGERDKLQELEQAYAEIANHITKLSDPGYFEEKIIAIDEKNLGAVEHIAALGAVETERASAAKVIERLWHDANKILIQMKPAAEAIIARMLKSVSDDIDQRIKQEQAEAGRLAVPVPSRSALLTRDPLPSLCKLGAQIEAAADELQSRSGLWRARNILTLSKAIQAAAPVTGI